MIKFIALLLCFFVALPASAQRFVSVAGNTNELMAQPVPNIHSVTLLKGYASSNENLNAFFQYIRASAATPDGISIFTPTFGAGVGRYHLMSTATIQQTNFTLITTNTTVIVSSNLTLITTNLTFITTNTTNFGWTFINAATTNIFYTTNLFEITNHIPSVGSATDNAVARFDGTSGRLLQNSVGILSDAGAMTGLASLTATSGVTAGWFKAGVSNAASILVVDGDSRTQGGLACAAPAWALGLVTTETFTLSNVGIGGNRLQDQAALAFANVDAKLSWFSRRNVVVIWCGVNDFRAGATGASVYSLISGYCKTRRLAGWSVIVATEVSAKESGIVYDTQKNDFNALVRAHWSEFADGIADLGANPFLGADGAYATNTYFCDEIHLTVAANVIVASIVSASIDRLTEGDDSRGNLTAQGIRVSGELNATTIGNGGVEIDWSGGEGRFLSYNRTTSAWRPLSINSLYTTFGNSGVEHMRLTGGLLGIGTTTPNAKLVVSASGAEGLEILPGYTTNLIVAQGINRNTAQYTTNDSHFGTYILNIGAATEAMRIVGNGDVGIGTPAPNAKLVVAANGAEGLEIFPGYTTNLIVVQGYNRNTAQHTTFDGHFADYRLNIGAATEVLRIYPAGTLSIAGAITNGALTANAIVGTDANKRLKSVALSGLSFDGTTLSTTGSGIAGSDTQVQFNDGGAFGGDAGFTFHKANDAITVVGGITNSALTASALTASDANKRLKSVAIGANLSYDGTTLSATGGGAGSVTSVALTMPSPFTVSGSPVTGAGTLAVTGVDPGADRLIGFDDGNGDIRYITIGAGLNYDQGTDTLTSTAVGVGGGDVVGPASATDNALSRFDGATGKLIQNSSVILDDVGWMSGVTNLTVTTRITNSVLTANALVSADANKAFKSVAIGANLTFDGTTLAAAGAGTGDFVGPSGATDNALVRFDTTTGKLGQDSAAILTDAGALSGVAALTVTGGITNQALVAGKVVIADANQRLSSILDPSKDAIYGWDNSSNQVVQMTIGSGLTYTTANGTLSATTSAIETAVFTKTLTNLVNTLVFEVAVPSGQFGSIRIEYQVTATDADQHSIAAREETWMFSNIGGSMDENVGRANYAGPLNSPIGPGHSLTMNIDFVPGVGKWTFTIEAISDIDPPLTTSGVVVKYRLYNPGGFTITNL